MTDSGATMGAPPPQRRWGLGKLLGIGCLGLIVIGVALFFLIMRLTQPVVDVADRFMTALRDGDHDGAYQLASPALQQQLGSAGQLATAVGANRPLEWSWSSRSINNDLGQVSGSVSYEAGRSGTAAIQLRQENGEWRITSYRLN